MSEGGKSGLDEQRRSLLSFSRDAATAADRRSSPTQPSSAQSSPPVSRAEDAQFRHRAARSRREARPNPFLDALAATGEPPAEPERIEPSPPPPRTAADEDRASAAYSAHTVAAPSSAQPANDGKKPARGRLSDYVRGWMPWRPALDDDRAPFGATTDMPMEAPTLDAEQPSSYARGRRTLDRDPGEGNREGWTPLIDPLRVIGAVFDAKLLIVATTVIGTLIGVAVALNTPKKYIAAAELVLDPRDLKLSERDLTQQGLPSDATLAIIETQVRIMTSGNVLAEVVKRLNLAEDSEFNGEAKSFGIRAFISELRSILSRSGNDGTADDGLRYTLAIENLSRALSVERGGKTFAVTIAAETQSPEKSALIANTMTDVFLQTYGKIQSHTAGRAADELTARLGELQKGVEAAERKVAAFKAENDIIDPQGRLITDDEIVKLNEQLSVARAHTLELNARAASVRGADVDAVLAGSIPESINSSSITELRSQYATLKNEADRVAVRLGPRHPERLAVEAQVAGARGQLAAELRRIASSIQVELKRAVELEQQLAQRLAQLKVRQGDLSGELVTLRELEREVATKRSVYESTLLRARETDEQRDINTANMSVISPAYPPLDPAGPSRSTLALTGTFLGFASGVGFAMLRGAYEGLRDSRRENLARRQRRAARDPGNDGAGPPPGGPKPVGPSGSDTRPRDGRDADTLAATSSGTSQPISGAFAQDHSSSGQEENSMPNRYAEQYYPVAYGQPMPVQGWAPASPMQPVGVYPEPQPQAYPLHQPQQFAPYPVNGQGPPIYAQPLSPGYAASGYPQPMQAYQQPVPPVAQPMSHYPYPPQRHHPQPMATVWAQQPPMSYPPAQSHGASAAAYPQMAYPYPQHPPMQPAPAPAYNVAAEPRRGDLIPFPPRHASETARSYAEEDNGSAGAIADIRASLAEFREAVRDFTETRQKRRFL